MTRTVEGTIALAEGATASFLLCDRYGRDIGNDPVTCVVGANGAFSAVLEVSGTQKCHAVQTDTGRVIFWVYEGASAQNVDLTQKNYPRNEIKAFLWAEPATAIENAKILVQRTVCNGIVVSEEEQRFVCRYEAYAAGEEDKDICVIDTGLGGLNG